jgi:hypothetical protein
MLEVELLSVFRRLLDHLTDVRQVVRMNPSQPEADRGLGRRVVTKDPKSLIRPKDVAGSDVRAKTAGAAQLLRFGEIGGLATAEDLLGLFALGDVARDLGEANELAVIVFDDVNDDVGPESGSILSQSPAFGFVSSLAGRSDEPLYPTDTDFRPAGSPDRVKRLYRSGNWVLFDTPSEGR